ncbi:hypothetical protein GQ44DRAFT_698983 [Phaeosphaeriaceae sp. PMI808]|nr:hypothetical protein GQ44DRAFT_698983 [Phaeosphaeriaceae sp. PMI808]
MIIITLASIFGSVYGASIMTALIRVATVVVYVFSSRILSVWYSRCICAQKVFVTYEDENGKNSIINRYNRMYPSSLTQSQVLGSRQQAIPSTPPRIPTPVFNGISMRTEEQNSLLTRVLDHSDST